MHSVHSKIQSGFFKFVTVKERFRKAQFSWLIVVDTNTTTKLHVSNHRQSLENLWYFWNVSLGECLDKINNFTCVCPTGFTGVRCEVNIDDCLLSPCGNGTYICFFLVLVLLNLLLRHIFRSLKKGFEGRRQNSTKNCIEHTIYNEFAVIAFCNRLPRWTLFIIPLKCK